MNRIEIEIAQEKLIEQLQHTIELQNNLLELVSDLLRLPAPQNAVQSSHTLCDAVESSYFGMVNKPQKDVKQGSEKE